MAVRVKPAIWEAGGGREVERVYTGQPYPLRTDRVVFLVDPERARAQTYG